MKQYGKKAMDRVLGKREITEGEAILLDNFNTLLSAGRVPHWHRKLEIVTNLLNMVDVLLDGAEDHERGDLHDIAHDIASVIERDKGYRKLKRKSEAKRERQFKKLEAERAKKGGNATE